MGGKAVALESCTEGSRRGPSSSTYPGHLWGSSAGETGAPSGGKPPRRSADPARPGFSGGHTHALPFAFPRSGGGDKLRHPPTRSYSGHPPRIPNPGVGAGPWKSSPPPATNPPRITLRGRRGGGAAGGRAGEQPWKRGVRPPFPPPPAAGRLFPTLPAPDGAWRGPALAGEQLTPGEAAPASPPPHHPLWFLVGKPCA